MKIVFAAALLAALLAPPAKADCADGCEMPSGGKPISQAPATEAEA